MRTVSENWFQRQSAGKKNKRLCKKTIKKFVWFFFWEQQKFPEHHLIWHIFPHTYSQENTYKSVGLRPTAMRYAMRYVVKGLLWAWWSVMGMIHQGALSTATGQVAEEVIWRCHSSVLPLNKPHDLYNPSLCNSWCPSIPYKVASHPFNPPFMVVVTEYLTTISPPLLPKV